MKIDSVSYAVASKVVKTFAMSVSRIRGYSAANGWLHVFDLKAVPASATGVVPKRSFPIYATAAFDVMLADEPLDFANGCVMAMSSVEGAYTALASTMDLFVTGTSYIDDTGWTVAGDYTTATKDLSIYTDAGVASKHLTRLEFTALTDAGAVLYAKLFSEPNPTVGTPPLAIMELPRNTSKDFSFDRVVETTAAGVVVNGIYVVIDATAGLFADNYAGTDYAIKGTYK